MGNCFGTDRIQHDVSCKFEKMTLLLDKYPQRIEFCRNSKELDLRVPSAYSPEIDWREKSR